MSAFESNRNKSANMAKGCCLIILRLFLIVSLPLSTVQMNYPWSSATSKSMTVCNDKECHDRAKKIMENMDKTVDPCNDFYQYVCGKWQAKHPIPPYKYEWSIEEKLDIEAINRMSNILKYGARVNEPKDVKEAKRIYKICNNLPSMPVTDAKHLKSIVKRAGPWPMFNPEQKYKVSWLDIHNYYLSVTVDAGLFYIEPYYDYKTGEFFVHLSHAIPPFGLIKRLSEWSHDDIVKHEYFLLILARIVADKRHEPDEKDLLQDIRDVLAFRYKLEKNIRPNLVEFSPMSIKYFQMWYEIKATSQKAGIKIPWLQIFQNLFKNTDLVINDDTKVDVKHRDAFGYLPRIFSNTPKHVIANHLHLYFIEKHILLDDDLNAAVTNLLITNGKIIGSLVPRLDRSAICVLKHPMKDTLGKLYVEQYFSKETQEKALHYGKNIQNMIKVHITASDWLNDEMKNMLISKLDDMNLIMGYQKEQEREDIDLKDNKMIPHRAVSFYAPKENSVFISAGYFRSPVYGSQLPSAVNYGTIGTFIAYEIYKALNGQHSQKEPTTSKAVCKYCWSDAMQKMLQKKSKCFQDMYTDLVDIGLEKIRPLPKTNGAQTLFENIADVMGIRTGMDVFKKILWESMGQCRVLPHLKDLTCEKLFFISYAATFCTASPSWALLKHMQMGTHSTFRLRVNVPLANMEEFKHAFHCSSSSPMVLNKSCYLW